MKVFRSRLYDCEVFHSRTEPVEHRFAYRYFTFCLDLDEIEALSRRHILFGTGRLKPFRFVAEDSLFGAPGCTAEELKRSIVRFAVGKGLQAPIARIERVAHVCTLGYSYNPAAFYFGYGEDDELLFGIVEVTNTFRERKAYFIPASPGRGDEIHGEEQKLFYVSPFVDLDSTFEFRLQRPATTLRFQIDSKSSHRVLHAVLTGKSRDLTDGGLFLRLVKFPFLTLGVMAKIHFQAARLYLKRVPFRRKADRPELQKGGLP